MSWDSVLCKKQWGKCPLRKDGLPHVCGSGEKHKQITNPIGRKHWCRYCQARK